MANANVPNSEFITAQVLLNTQLKEKWPTLKLEIDKLGEPILWCENSTAVLETLIELKSNYTFDYLSDITAYDNEDGIDGEKRFILVYQIYSLTNRTRIRIKCAVEMDEEAQSIVGVWPAADWLEREVYDMFGIKFKDHPNMVRIMMDDRFTGFPLRKEYPIKLREPFSDNMKINLSDSPSTSQEF